MAALWSALIIALACGVTGIFWQWRRAKADEQLATIEAGKSRQLAEFLRQMLARAGPSASLGRDTTLLREILDQTAERIESELTTQPAVAAELRDTIGRTYYDLGDYAKAVAMHRAALRLRRQGAGHQQAEVAQSIHLLAQALASQGVLDEAEALDREALALRTKLLGPQSTPVADSLNNIGNLYFRRRELNEAQRYFEQALAIYRRTDNQSRTAAVLNNLANVLELKPDYAAAETLYREAVDIARRIHGDSHPSTALYLRNLGESLRGQDKLKEADAIHSEALAVRASLLDELHPLLVDSFERLAQTKKQEEKLTEAETLYRKALALRRKQSPGDPRKWSDDAYAVAALLCQRKEFDECERLLGELLGATKDSDPRTASLRAARGNIRARYGRWRDAIPDLARAFDLERTNQWHALHLATLLAETGEREAYSAFCRKCLEAYAETENPDIAQRMAFACLLAPVDELDQQAVHRLVDHALDAGPDYDNRPYAMAVKAMAEYRSGRAPEAVQRLDTLLEQINSGQFQPGRYLNIEVRALQALAHHASGRREEARQWLAAAQEFAPAKLRPPANGDYGEFWREWLMLHVLVREAEQIENPGSALNPAAPKR
jgi:tetratricopeptide (TPR) repeat protein